MIWPGRAVMYIDSLVRDLMSIGWPGTSQKRVFAGGRCRSF